MKAPFPYFGGKSSIAHEVWSRFGDVPNYVEPFAGSLAVLLSRPSEPRIETVNDLDGLLSNFWRAIQADPEAVARWADWPVNENDLHARHAWLVQRKESLQSQIEGDPDFFDAKIAGWWVWGTCAWIGSGFCSGNGPWQQVDGLLVNTSGNAGQGINRNLPHLGDAGQGINRKRPHLGTAGQGINRKRENLIETFQELSDRLRNVRVCCGDWSRVCGPSATFKHGLTGVFLDPPYADTASRTKDLYRQDCFQVAHDVRRWAVENGGNLLLKIALCGYEGEHEMPSDWECFRWKARGGFGSQGEGRGRKNAARECIWFSPACIQADLFACEATR